MNTPAEQPAKAEPKTDCERVTPAHRGGGGGDLRRSESVICSTCGPTRGVWVNSHEQCAKCGRVLVSCCDGR